MSEWKAKRFWKEARAEQADDGWLIRLDGRELRTPRKSALRLPGRALAEALAEEWQAQGEVIDPTAMPLTRTANSAVEQVATQHGAVADMLADYADADLLCYRADAPAELAARQEEAWDPLLDWAAEELGARLETRTGVMHAPQPAQALDALRARVHALDAFEMAAFHDLVTLSGSLVLGFATAHGRIAPEEAWRQSRIDEDWQIEQWGPDAEAEELASRRRAAFLDADRFYRLIHAKD